MTFYLTPERQERRQAILSEYIADVKISEIAEKYGVHVSYPGWIARREGLPTRRPGRKRTKAHRPTLAERVAALDDAARACFERNVRTGATKRQALKFAVEDMAIRARVAARQERAG